MLCLPAEHDLPDKENNHFVHQFIRLMNQMREKQIHTLDASSIKVLMCGNIPAILCTNQESCLSDERDKLFGDKKSATFGSNSALQCLS